MEHRKRHVALIAGALLLASGSGCLTPDALKKKGDVAAEPKKPDVTQPGVLPPPQEIMKPLLPSGTNATAGAIQPAAAKGVPAPIAADIPVTKAGTAVPVKPADPRKVQATNIGVAWRNRIEYLPDPSRNGAPGPGLAGQMFLFGGPKLDFALADGTLTVDLVDDTPRPPGQPAATPERWQIDKQTLRNWQTNDETFGRSYVLFLPWPAYKPDITRVKIRVQYDPDGGYTLYQSPVTVTLDNSPPGAKPVWEEKSFSVQGGGPKPQLPAQPFSFTHGPLTPSPLPLGGAPSATPSGATLEGLPPIALTGGR